LDVTIRHRKVDVPDDLRIVAEEKVSRLSRFLDGMDHAEIIFSEEKNPRISEKEVCEVTLTGHGHFVRARATAPDAFTAVDRVVDKLEHQITRLKGKLVGRSHPRRHSSVNSAKTDHSVDEDTSDDGDLQIVKTKRFPIKPMTPEEAVLQMELLGHDFYFFTNAENQQAAVVYRRNDGAVGLIEAS
jgi:putative sigma-54 modulation protein